MEIIRVVHAQADEEISQHRQSFALETYKFDVNAFVSQAFDKKTALEWLQAFNEVVNPYGNHILSLGVRLLSAAGAPSQYVENLDFNKQKLRNFADRISKSVVEDIRDKIKDVKVLPLESAKLRYPRTSNLSLGTYTLHPYDSGRLTRLESYHTNLAMEKDDELVILLGRMGAKTIRIVELGIGTASLNISGATNAPADIAAKMSVKSQSGSGNDLLVSFAGNAVEMDENMLKTSLWFSHDSKLNSILDSRRFNPNRIEQYTLKSTYLETFDFDFDLAAKFTGLKVDAKAQYQSLSQKERLFHVEFGR